EMKRVQHIRILQWTVREQRIKARPVWAAGDDRVVRGDVADCANELLLNAPPAHRQHAKDRLVDRLEEDRLWIRVSQLMSKLGPEADKAARTKRRLDPIADAVHRDRDGQSVIDH